MLCQDGPLLIPQPPIEEINEPSTSVLPSSNESSTIEELKSRVATLERTIQVMQRQQERTSEMIDTLLQVLGKT